MCMLSHPFIRHTYACTYLCISVMFFCSRHPPESLQQPIRLPLSLVSGRLLTLNPGPPDPALQILFLSTPNPYPTAIVQTTLHLPRLQHPVCRTSLRQFPPDPDPDHYLKNRIRTSDYPPNRNPHLVPLPVFHYLSAGAALPFR